MRLNACPREKEVSELMARGWWPQACPPELRVHVRACRACADLVLVTDAMLRARAQSAGPVNIASPGLLWWRAQLRRRNEAMERISRPLLGAEIFAMAVVLLGALGFAGYEVRQSGGWLHCMARLSRNLESFWPAALSGAGGRWMVMLTALAALLLGGLAVYLAAEKQ